MNEYLYFFCNNLHYFAWFEYSNIDLYICFAMFLFAQSLKKSIFLFIYICHIQLLIVTLIMSIFTGITDFDMDSSTRENIHTTSRWMKMFLILEILISTVYQSQQLFYCMNKTNKSLSIIGNLLAGARFIVVDKIFVLQMRTWIR